MPYSLERMTPSLPGDKIADIVMAEVAKDIERILAEKMALESETSNEVKNAVFSSVVFGEGLLVTRRDFSVEPTMALDDLLYPSETLDEDPSHDTVAAAVEEALGGFDDILSRAVEGL